MKSESKLSPRGIMSKLLLEKSLAECDHTRLNFEPSAYADNVGFKRQTKQQRVAASLLQILPKNKQSGKTNAINAKDHPISKSSHESYPAPLVLPQDDLALDTEYPPQSLRSWLHSKDRNELTNRRNTIYVAAPPDVSSDIEYMSTWSRPQQIDRVRDTVENCIPIPDIQDVVEYLAAFYHGLPVKQLLAPKLQFTTWDDGSNKPSRARKTSSKPPFIGLNTATESIRIRTRAPKDKVFLRQLNLDDLLDAAISILPDDAYALLLLVEQDLYESADDVFVCGRAYGGSRVAVVSTARYHPSLDVKNDVERQHSWPASHCDDYLRECCATAFGQDERPRKRARIPKGNSTSTSTKPLQTNLIDQTISTPLQAAVSAHKALSELSSSPKMLTGLWLGRVCRTASHELGHCFGIDHCVYYACAMQGSASLAEDARQPPYLCPIDLAKMLQATGTEAEQRYLALLGFCNQHKDIQLFAAFAAWIEARLSEMKING